jgi:iron-sulfur cluster repair protein YtfE (RIC family)
MFSLKTAGSKEAMSLLKKDHDKVKKLFDRFDKADSTAEKKEIAREACMELEIHSAVEEQLFYPALRQRMDDEDGLIDEADEEHHEAKILVAELKLMSGDEENYSAKFEVLAENIRHHIKEEEGSLFPKAKKTGIDFDALGERMRELKDRLTAEGVEPGAEAKMVEKFGVAAQSPSREAMKSFSAPMSEKKRARKH